MQSELQLCESSSNLPLQIHTTAAKATLAQCRAWLTDSAKHLRSHDRLVNAAHYPKIFYPEVYILEGGYCNFFSTHAKDCTGGSAGYIPMDDPRHFERRRSDLADFRKFSRTQSFTYGEARSSAARSMPCPPLAFAAASAAVTRRGHTAASIAEEDDPDSSFGEHDVDESPSQRVAPLQQPIFGSAAAKGRPMALKRMGFSRVASYAGSTAR